MQSENSQAGRSTEELSLRITLPSLGRLLMGAGHPSVGANSLVERGKPQTTKKSPVQIRFEILEFLFYDAGPHSRTSIWRHATQLSYDDFQKYLEILKQKGFVEESGGEIHLAPSGREVYLKLREALPLIL